MSYVLIKFFLKVIPEGPNDNNSTLIQVKVWHLIHTKSLPKAIMTTDVIIMP